MIYNQFLVTVQSLGSGQSQASIPSYYWVTSFRIQVQY